MTLQLKDLSVEKKTLFVPPLDEIASGKSKSVHVAKITAYVNLFAVLGKGLTSNFEHVAVEVVDCPDLTQKPFTLANKGRYSDKIDQ